MDTTFLQSKSFKIAVISIAAVFSLIIILTAGSFAYAGLYHDKIYHGVSLDGFNLGGLTIDQAEKIISGQFSAVYDPGFTFKYQETEKNIPMIISGAPVMSIDSAKVARAAFEYSHPNNRLTEFTRQIQSLILGKKLHPEINFDRHL
ncbi:MAG TPA: hypothetical protein VJB62_03305, partial [Patescibacteria group bacterium]|nr:hypothetical protein [Patescibacteria group bacterium]